MAHPPVFAVLASKATRLPCFQDIKHQSPNIHGKNVIKRACTSHLPRVNPSPPPTIGYVAENAWRLISSIASMSSALSSKRTTFILHHPDTAGSAPATFDAARVRSARTVNQFKEWSSKTMQPFVSEWCRVHSVPTALHVMIHGYGDLP